MREIKNFGFLDHDILSSCRYGTTNGELWLFNHGTYGRTSRLLNSIGVNDYPEIEDWLSNRFRDENMEIDPNIKSASIVLKGEFKGALLKDYPEEEINGACLRIKFSYQLLSSTK